MQGRLSIGEFSRMTHLSVRTLRRYHESGLLEPAEIDEWSSYRYYRPTQIPIAQTIRRFRELTCPCARSPTCSASTIPMAATR